VKRALGDAYELDDDPQRIDVAAVHRFLCEESYWARGRELETVRAIVGEAARVVGLYHDGALVGFCRAARCAPQLFYLGDVYVLAEHRGRGLGRELVAEMVERGPLANAKWILHTEDAHELYRGFDFDEPGYKLMERSARG
jgi:GNAT superfamily N-acetyltransferase